MGNYIGAAANVSNASVVCQTLQSLVNDKLSIDNSIQ